MSTVSNVSRVARLEFNAKVRFISFIAVFIFMIVFFLATPTSQISGQISGQISAAEERVNWDNRCFTEQCQ